jgi:hypothetical protein
VIEAKAAVFTPEWAEAEIAKIVMVCEQLELEFEVLNQCRWPNLGNGSMKEQNDGTDEG